MCVRVLLMSLGMSCARLPSMSCTHRVSIVYAVYHYIRVSTERTHARRASVERALRPKRGGAAIAALHERDDPLAATVTNADEAFLPLAGEIGALCVQKWDKAPVMACVDAWLESFVPRGERLEGTAGGAWTLEEEVTWKDFKRVCKRAPSGKAVGEGGMSKELIAKLPEDALYELFLAIKADLRSGNISRDWRTILYVLIPKPPPNRRDVVAENREIALMAQEMKFVLQVLRQKAYSRISRRLLADQVGWVGGLGAFDVALSATLALQQARKMRQDLYLIYIDLASFFSTIGLA